MLDRRHLMLGAAGSVACAVAAGTTLAANSVPPGPPLPPRDWSNSNPTVPYPDPNVQALDPRLKSTSPARPYCGASGPGPNRPRARCGSATCIA